MTHDDLPRRLRSWKHAGPYYTNDDGTKIHLADEAADEIERLRHRIAGLEDALRPLANLAPEVERTFLGVSDSATVAAGVTLGHARHARDLLRFCEPDTRPAGCVCNPYNWGNPHKIPPVCEAMYCPIGSDDICPKCEHGPECHPR